MTALKIYDSQPDENVINFLKYLLELAESGELISIAVAMHTKGNCAATAIELGNGNVAYLNLAADLMKERILSYVSE